MFALKLIPAWAYVAALAAIVALVQQYRVNSVEMALAGYMLEVSERDNRTMASARAEEHRRANAVRTEQEKAAHEIATAQADAAAASASVDSLRQQLAKLRTRLAHRDAAATGDRQAAKDALGVLAELLDESVRRNEVLAESLDRSRIAGHACERMYSQMHE